MTVETYEADQPSVLTAAKSHKVLVISVTLAFAVASLLYSLSQPPLFEAVTILVLDERDPAQAVRLGGAIDEDRLVRNQLQILRSASVARKASTLLEAQDLDVSVGHIIDGAAFTNLGDTDVITISYSHEASDIALAVVNALVDGYRQVRAEQSRAQSQLVLDELEAAAEVLQQQFAEIDAEISELRLPRGLTAQVATLLDQMSIVSSQAGAATGAAREALLAEVGALSDQLGSLQLALQVEGQAPEISSRLRQQQNLVDQIATLAGRRIEMEIEAEAAASGIGFVAEPSTTSSGSAAGMIFTLIAGAFLGLLIALGLAFYRSQSKSWFTDRLEPQRRLGIPFLADVPNFTSKSLLPVRDSPRSPEAESFRFVAANLDFLLMRSNARSVLVTSEAVGDGKSTVVANTALACARAGRQVLVIDADFGNQALTQLFLGKLDGRPGLTEVVAGRVHHQEVVVALNLPDGSKIDLMSRGQERIAAIDVFANERMEQVLDSLSTAYDLVLIDGPPLMRVAYAAILARHADAIVTVIAAGADINAAIELERQLRFLDIPLLGYVYNKAPLRHEMAAYGGSMKDVLGDLGSVPPVPVRGGR